MGFYLNKGIREIFHDEKRCYVVGKYLLRRPCTSPNPRTKRQLPTRTRSNKKRGGCLRFASNSLIVFVFEFIKFSLFKCKLYEASASQLVCRKAYGDAL